MFLFIENAIRGGIIVVSHRHAKANNPSSPIMTHNSQTLSSLITMPTMCMVGQCQNYWLLQSSHFWARWYKIIWPWRYNEIGRLRLYTRSQPQISGTPSRRTLRLPSRCWKIINHTRFVVTLLCISHRQTRSSEKLSPNLFDKTKYVLHYENLRFYLKHGLQLTKIHRILKFRQIAWMKPYIDFNTA